MTDIALYNLLRRIPNATDDEIEKVVTDVASSKEVATKEFIKVEIANLETRLTNIICAVAGVIIAAIGLIMAAIGLMIKFL